ncbi:MAG: toll/interleukin-1 receptor domain-containing protein [Gammaproteobacteria bacterium]|jgi:hypothetical protein
MIRKKLFLASSAELSDERKEFEIFVNRKNKGWVERGVFLELIVWEDFLDAVSRTRLQDEYNAAIRGCDVFVMLFWTKVGPYTAEEFETAFGQFQATHKPFIFTYFKDAASSMGSANDKDWLSLLAFQEKLKALGHFYTRYKNVDQLTSHFNRQLDKLVARGFIEFNPDPGEAGEHGTTYRANLTGSGAIAQGPGHAVGAGGVYVGGKNVGNINTGTQTHINTAGGTYVGGGVDTGGGDFIGRDKLTFGTSPRDLEPLFAPLLAAVAQHASRDKQAAAVQQVQALKVEVAKGQHADDSKVAKILDGLVAMVPGAVGAVVSLFAAPILRAIAGPVTQFVLDKVKGS